MAPFSKILSSRRSWLRVSFLGRPGENPTRRESAPRRRQSFRQRITELAAQWTRRATSFRDKSSSNSFSARLRRSESRSAEPFGRIWTSRYSEVHYCIILCEVNRASSAKTGAVKPPLHGLSQPPQAVFAVGLGSLLKKDFFAPGGFLAGGFQLQWRECNEIHVQ